MRKVKWLAFAALLLGCTDEGATYGTLRAAGYSAIQLTGYEFYTCGQGDNYCTGFRAKGPTGVVVRGAVGCGAFGKGCTIRITGTN